MARHIQGILNKMVRFPIRNLGGQKAVGCYIQSAKKKKKKSTKPCEPRILHPVKLSFRNESEIILSPSQDYIKAKCNDIL